MRLKSLLGIAGGGCSWGWRGEDIMLGQGAPHEFLAPGEAGDGQSAELVNGLLGGATPKAPAQGLNQDLRQALLVHPGDGWADELRCFLLGGVGLDLLLAGGSNFAKLAHLVRGQQVRARVS